MTETAVLPAPAVPTTAVPPAAAEVGLLLSRSGLPATAEELAVLAAGHEFQQAALAGLYSVPEARYVDPALRFRADARLTDWSE
ncbi:MULTISPECIES: hypothetical protein [Thermomonosporaceae]|uniref:hypothetical protein n=1 Tax=Thermomonosporaceae TaxID=2012 RepID=UPI00255AB80A|nr:MULTISPECIES: hypothetical protein [Thermomonosporaceae]MDL4777798.1 hypothetical protein [Actinomadura xylanilytica]